MQTGKLQSSKYLALYKDILRTNVATSKNAKKSESIYLSEQEWKMSLDSQGKNGRC